MRVLNSPFFPTNQLVYNFLSNTSLQNEPGILTNLAREIIQHCGSIDGYSSCMGFNPAKQVELVQLCSCQGEDMPIQVREALAAFNISKLT